MKKFLVLIALMAPSVAFAQDLEQQAAQASTSPLAAWSSVLSPQMQNQAAIQQPRDIPCAIVAGYQPKKGEELSFETDVNKCFVPKPDQSTVGLKEAEQVNPKGQRGDIVAPVK